MGAIKHLPKAMRSALNIGMFGARVLPFSMRNLFRLAGVVTSVMVVMGRSMSFFLRLATRII